jgi:hypothetical protein
MTSTLSCSFCGKSQRYVRKLIAGPCVYICDECVGLCRELISDAATDDGIRRAEERGADRFVGWLGAHWAQVVVPCLGSEERLSPNDALVRWRIARRTEEDAR